MRGYITIRRLIITMYSEAAVNQRLLDDYAFSRASKSEQERITKQKQREGWAKRNPELLNDSHTDEMKQYLPKVELSEYELAQQLLREQALSANLNVSQERIDSLTDHSKHKEPSLFE